MKVIAQDTISVLYGDFVDSVVGRRNLIRNSSGTEKAGFFKNFSRDAENDLYFTLTSKQTYVSIITPGATLTCNDYESGAHLVWSYDIMYTKWDVPDGANLREIWMGQRYNGAGGNGWMPVTQHSLPKVGVNGCELNEWYHHTVAIVVPERDRTIGIDDDFKIQLYNSNPDVEVTISVKLKNVKLEYGDTPSKWTPAPEDLESRLLSAETSIENNANQIKLSAKQTDVDTLNNDLVAYKEISTSMIQDINGWQFNWNTILNANGADPENHSDYITFLNGDLILGESSNDLKVKISNDSIQFKGASETEVTPDLDATAWISGQKFNINEGEVHTTFKVGNLQFVPRPNGNFCLIIL